MFSIASLMSLKRFITPTTVMLLVIFILSGTVWYQNTVIDSQDVTIKNQSEKIASLKTDNKTNQKSIESMKLTNSNMAEKMLEQNRRIERIHIDYGIAIDENKKRVESINKKYEKEIKRILGSTPPKIVDFNCSKDKDKAIDAIQAMEFLLMEDKK